MADIELVIKIPEEIYEASQIIDVEYEDVIQIPLEVIKNCTPLPKGHGDLIDRNLVLSDDGLCEFHMYDDYVKMKNYLKLIPTIIEAEKGERK